MSSHFNNDRPITLNKNSNKAQYYLERDSLEVSNFRFVLEVSTLLLFYPLVLLISKILCTATALLTATPKQSMPRKQFPRPDTALTVKVLFNPAVSAFTPDMSMTPDISASSTPASLTLRNDETVETFSHNPSAKTYKESTYSSTILGLRSTVHVVSLIQISKKPDTIL